MLGVVNPSSVWNLIAPSYSRKIGAIYITITTKPAYSPSKLNQDATEGSERDRGWRRMR